MDEVSHAYNEDVNSSHPEPIMKIAYQARSIVVASVVGVVLLASGCDKYTDSGQTVGQKLDKAIDKTNASIAKAGDKVEQKVDQAGAVVAGVSESVAIRTGVALDQTGNAVSNKVNQVGNIVTDSAITASIKADLVKDPGLSAIAIEVNTVKGEVTLKGEVSSEVRKQRAEAIARNIVGVTAVSNQLTVKPS